MRLVRTATALAIAGSLFAVGHSQAAVKKSLPCNLVTDDKGDADIDGNGTGNDAALDLTSVDFGADKKTMTIVMRVDKASTKSSVYPAGSIKFQTSFTVAGAQYFVSVISDSTVGGYFGTTGTGRNTILTYPTAVIDPASNEVRISVPVSDFPTPYKIGDAVTGITTSTAFGVVRNSTGATFSTGGFGVDSATADVTYKAGNTTCVTVGK